MIKKRYTWLIYEYEVITSVYTNYAVSSKYALTVYSQHVNKYLIYVVHSTHWYVISIICFSANLIDKYLTKKKGGKITQIRQKCIFLGKKCCGCCLFLFTPWSDFGTTTKQLRKKKFFCKKKKKKSTFCPYGERILHCCFSLSFFFFFLFFLNRTVHESIWIF